MIICSTHKLFIRAVFLIAVAFSSYSVSGKEHISANEEVMYLTNTYTYKTVDNLEIQADVYRNPGSEIRPAIIYIHGGGLITGSRINQPPIEQLDRFLESGYVVISIDYRLAPETKLAQIIQDLEDAYTWVRRMGPELFNVDPNRIAIMGMSAGGYLTLMAGFRLTPRPQALVSLYGYGDITGPWYSKPDTFYNQKPAVPKEKAFEAVRGSAISGTPTESSWQGRGDFYLYCRQNGLWPKEVSGHDPEIERDWYVDYEPRRNVTSEYPPTMLLHGEKDTDVPFEQSVLMAEALKKHNVDYEFISNPDWGHAFDYARKDEPAVQDAFGRILIFLQKYVR